MSIFYNFVQLLHCCCVIVLVSEAAHQTERPATADCNLTGRSHLIRTTPLAIHRHLLPEQLQEANLAPHNATAIPHHVHNKQDGRRRGHVELRPQLLPLLRLRLGIPEPAGGTLLLLEKASRAQVCWLVDGELLPLRKTLALSDPSCTLACSDGHPY